MKANTTEIYITVDSNIAESIDIRRKIIAA